MKKKALIVAGLSLMIWPPAHAEQDWRALILGALQSPTGSVDTVLTGPYADQAKWSAIPPRSWASSEGMAGRVSPRARHTFPSPFLQCSQLNAPL